MPSVEFAHEAVEDISSIVAYTIDHWGPDQARKHLLGLRDSCAELAKMPSVGKEVTWLAPGVRSFPYQSRVIYYADRKSGITVLAIVHKRQDPRRRLQTAR